MKLLKILLVLLFGVSVYAAPKVLYTTCSEEAADSANFSLYEIANILTMEDELAQETQNLSPEKRLIKACRENNKEEAKKLLQSGVSVNATDSRARNMSVLAVASMKGYADIVKILLEHGADITFTDDKGYTALMLAAAFGHGNVVKEFSEAHKSGKINIKLTINQVRTGENNKKYSALSYACTTQKATQEVKNDIIKELQKYGAKDPAGVCDCRVVVGN